METPELTYYRRLLAEAESAYPSIDAARAAATFAEGDVFKHVAVRAGGAVHHFRLIKNRQGEIDIVLDHVTDAYALTEARRRAVQAEGERLVPT